jgi:hypothetical protein
MPRRAALLAVLLLALLSVGTASAAFRQFRSPTGKVGCAFFSDRHVPREVRCDWRGGNDRAVMVAERGRAKRIHVTDTVLDPNAKVLRYGTSTKFGALKCTSRRSGITCRSSRSGHGFTASVQRRRLF